NEQEYNRNISSMEDKYSEADRRYRNIMSDHVFAKTEMTEDDRLFLNNLAETISVLSEQGELDLKTLAKTMHVSVSGMRTRLDKLVSETPQSYILKVRMSKAKYLLHNFRDMPISEVAEKCGYMQLPNFTRAVTKYYGVTPTQMRNTAPVEIPKPKA
ncbi:MAG: helix-turn-helix transcriptional regulator, partial [Paludibacteraceae bacterium]|nr:helix-turn-helix transcriptional regulator [Paludibacteraceae bacterium]